MSARLMDDYFTLSEDKLFETIEEALRRLEADQAFIVLDAIDEYEDNNCDFLERVLSMGKQKLFGPRTTKVF